jgi:predicted O-methyltransferase YrrM
MKKRHPLLLLARDAVYTSTGPAYGALFKLASSRCKTLHDHLRLTERLRYRGWSINALQKEEEIIPVLEMIRGRGYRTIVEIGTAHGGTFYLFCQAASADAHLVSIDLPGGRFGGGYSWWQSRLFRSFARHGQKISLLRTDSHAESTKAELEKTLDGAPIDFLLIDGDHTYDGVKRDYELYAPLVRPGGAIAFHDIVPGPEENVGGVPRFWQELKAGGDTPTEFVRDWGQGGMGLGVLEVRDGSPDR